MLLMLHMLVYARARLGIRLDLPNRPRRNPRERVKGKNITSPESLALSDCIIEFMFNYKNQTKIADVSYTQKHFV